MTRAVRIAVLLLILGLGAVWGATFLVRKPGETLGTAFARLLGDSPAPSAGGVALPGGVSVGGPFTLVDGDGKTVTEANLRGKLALVFFGYTFCPDVCPTELQAVAQAMDLLGPQADQVRPVFVTIDPERDTPAKIKDYVALFHPSILGLTGTPAQVSAAARAWRVYYAKVTPPGASDYLMDHSAFTYLMGRDGSLRTLFRPGATPEEMATAIRAQLG
ncbi:SCO family protein [Pararoseomonas indoligenes]|uniref:SCO family protein n=1 Tax=Roseomonas indoligenes TaxID=2820811 RepID=A0A940MWW0_9PROT|nr:SCO family protein [Pararoseomonas indoligenes]MBP0493566.1 SCO family protein [Pararoseomonas indoligenes]